MTDDLLVKYLLGEASTSEQEAVQQWIALSPSNAKYFEDLQKIWQTSTRLAYRSTANEDQAWQRFRSRIHKQTAGQSTAARSRSVSFGWARIAATVIVLAGIGVLALLLTRNSSEPSTIVARATVIKDTLADGSAITLNKNSTVEVAGEYNRRTRILNLTGEAFFTVKRDQSKPFIVRTGNVSILVTGTSFNVKQTDSAVEVIVETGVVRVTQNQKTVELTAGEKATADLRNESLTKDAANDRLHNYYHSREFVCDNTPLWKLVTVLNEAYGSNIIIGNDKVRNLTITTTFRDESLDRILEITKLTLNVEIEKKPDSIIIK